MLCRVAHPTGPHADRHARVAWTGWCMARSRAAYAPDVAKRLDLSLFNEQLTLTDRTSGTHAITVHGPAALDAAARAIEQQSTDASQVRALDRSAHRASRSAPIRWPRTRRAGSEWEACGCCRTQETIAGLVAALAGQGVSRLSSDAVDALRIESGTPLFGVDMTTDTIPLEAGIESRAISMTKGCYVGQEVIVRILHRGHGRVVRRLVGLIIGERRSAGRRYGDLRGIAGGGLGHQCDLVAGTRAIDRARVRASRRCGSRDRRSYRICGRRRGARAAPAARVIHERSLRRVSRFSCSMRAASAGGKSSASSSSRATHRMS